MRRSATIAIGVGLMAASLTLPAHGMTAGGGSGVRTTLYLHGETPAGETEIGQDIVESTFMPMDATEPTDPAPKSKTYGWGNTQCAGNRMFGVWHGRVTGSISNLKVTFTSVSVPQDIDVRIWTDVNEQWCNNDYPNPQAAKTITVPAGQSEVTVAIPRAKFAALGTMLVQISPSPSLGTDTPGPGRILYDSALTPSRVEFDCVPAKGKRCV